ncbi:MAG TPA: methyltransferase [Gemmatales bacterium]|nr:methyltransferase [Gemmatales bacterium]HMP60395.1 methyltransferase [Gemmatales bacterium]
MSAGALPPLPMTPADAIGAVHEERVELDGTVLLIGRPADPDRLLDHPATLAAFGRDEYMPYWCDLWPAARMLAKAVLAADWPAGLKALELGCGLGLPGVAALKKGLHVTFSDYDAAAVAFAAANARRNGLSNFEELAFDWRNPPDRQFPLILASDLIYEERNVAPVVAVVGRLLAPEGECWLTDQDRRPAALLREMLSANGFEYETQVMRAGQPRGPGQPTPLRMKGTLYRIRRR